MNSSPNILADIWEAYKISRESFKITRRSIIRSDPKLLKDTRFSLDTLNQAEGLGLVQRSENHIEDFYVVFLWATFERYVIQYVKNKGEKLKDINPNMLAINLYDKYIKEVEYWKITDTLDLLKEIIGSTIKKSVNK